MKPFIVEMTIRAVVMAADEDNAFIVARTQFRDIARDETPDVFVEGEVSSEDELPDGWDLGCIPYGGDGNTRLDKLLVTSTETTENNDTCRFCEGQGEVQGQGSAPDIDPPIKKCSECNGSGKASYYRALRTTFGKGEAA